MASKWPVVRVEDVCNLIVDCVNKTAPVAAQPTPFRMIRTTNVRNGRIDLSDCKFVDEETFKIWTRRAQVRAGDVILTREAPIGEVGFVPEQEGLFLGQRLMQYRADPSKLDQRFLLYSFLSPHLQHQFGSHEGSGSVVSHIRVGDCFKFELPLPPLDIQQKIGEALGALDDKIDINRRINQTLEAMAQAIFKSWFVDFDPVKAKIAAKAEGRDPLRAAMTAISGKPEAELDTLPPDQFAHLAATAALFPDEMDESELGEIPKGWQVNKVGQLLELAYGKALKATDRVDGPIPVYGSGGVTGSHNTALVNHGSVIVGRKGTVGALYWEDGPFFPIDTTFYVRPIAAPMTYCFYLLQTLGLDKMNTDAAVPGLNRENAYRLEHVLPSSKVLEAFDTSASLLRSAIRANTASSTSLSLLRDTLLPKLLSGECVVPASTSVAAAVGG
jgi:type I restriction enzyme S subunit